MESKIIGITARGAVFIKKIHPEADKDFFVLARSLNWKPQIGDEVTFELGPAPEPGKSPQALNVRLTKVVGATPLPPKEPETKKQTAAPAQIVKPVRKRLEIHVGKIRPDKTYVVNLLTRNAKLKPSKGTVQIYAGQKCRFAEAETPSGYGQFETGDDGCLFTVLQLEEFDAYVTFKHEESGEEIKRFFLKEE